MPVDLQKVFDLNDHEILRDRYTLFYKKQFYKQCQIEFDKKPRKNTKQHPEAERIHIFHQRHHPKIIEYIQKTRKKTSVSVFMRLYD